MITIASHALWTFTLSNESSSERRRLDVVFSDVSTAINSFLAVQSLLDVDTEHRETREQLQWKIAQLQVSKMLGKTSKRSEKDNEIAELEPLFAYVQKAVCTAASSGCRDSYRAALARHKSAVHTLPLPSSNERIRRLVTPEQYRKDLTREPGVSINGVLFPMSSSKNYEIFVRELSSSLSKFEESHIQDVLRSVSRTLTDGDAFSVLHRLFSVGVPSNRPKKHTHTLTHVQVPRSVLLTPCGPQIPVRILVSNNRRIVTVQCVSTFNAVHLSKDPRKKPQVWATLETTVVENLYLQSGRGNTVRRVRHLTIRM